MPFARVAPPSRARRFVLPIVALAALGVVVAKTGLPPLWVVSAHRAITRTMAGQKIPGLSVAVVSGGAVRWSAGYGLADVENHVPARADTVYRWASVSKPVTAVAVMQLAESGRIDLDAPIQTYVPTFPKKPWPITCRQLLAHLGGLRHYRGSEHSGTRHYADFRDAFAIFQDDPLVCEPGTKHAYSSYGYNLLGAAVEGASHRPYLDYVRARIFRPAGMATGGDCDIEAIIPRRSRGYRITSAGLRNARPVDPSGNTPGGGLCGTVVDAAKFGAAVMAGDLLPAKAVEAMFTRQQTRDGRPFDYGLGWSVLTHKGHKEVCHAGHNLHGTTILYMRPDRKLVVVLMCNLEQAELLPLARQIAAAAAP